MTIQYAQNPQVETLLIDEEHVLVHGDCCTVTKLNEVGLLIWSKLAVPQSAEELASGLHMEYDIGGEEAKCDVDDFLGNLIKLDLVRHAG